MNRSVTGCLVNNMLRKTKIRHEYPGCPKCGDVAEVVSQDYGKNVFLCACNNCGFTGESDSFSNAFVEYWVDSKGNICKPGIADLVRNER